MTAVGGANGYGNVFSIHTDGSGFRNVFSFKTAATATFAGSLTLSGSTLYGMTERRWRPGLGNVFSVKTEGSGFQNLVSFNGVNGTYTGQYPIGSLTLGGSTLYGMTFENSPFSALLRRQHFQRQNRRQRLPKPASFNGIDGTYATLAI